MAFVGIVFDLGEVRAPELFLCDDTVKSIRGRVMEEFPRRVRIEVLPEFALLSPELGLDLSISTIGSRAPAEFLV